MISAVVLAAGASTRMGTNKLLLSLGGEPIVRRTTRQVCDAGYDEVLVVLGRDAERTRAALDGLPCRFAVNVDYETGMGSSFRTAIAHLGDSDAAMVALADQPFVTSDQYRRLHAAYTAAPTTAPPAGTSAGAGATAPLIVSVRYGDVVAPPHLFARALFADLARLTHGAKPLLIREAAASIVLEFPPDQLVDIDTPEDYDRAQQRLSPA